MAKMSKDCWESYPNFKPSEFRCECGKCSRSKEAVDMDCRLIRILQKVRNKYNLPVTITSGYRCQSYNDSLKGSVKGSYHTKGKAADFTCNKCKTLQGRKEIMKYMKTLEGYKYSYCNENGSHPNMGTSIHIEVK